MKEALIEIKLKKTINENTILNVKLTGVKNPIYIGETNSNFFLIEARH